MNRKLNEKLFKELPRAFIGWTKKDKHKYIDDMNKANKDAKLKQQKETDFIKKMRTLKGK